MTKAELSTRIFDLLSELERVIEKHKEKLPPGTEIIISDLYTFPKWPGNKYMRVGIIIHGSNISEKNIENAE